MVENCSQTLTTESSVVLALVNGVSGISTKVGNSIILLALYKAPSLQTVSNYFVGSLAGADLFVGLFANSLYVALSGFVSLQEIQELKNTETFVWLFTTTITTLRLCFVAIDCYVAISRPLLYLQIFTTNRFFLATMCMWIFAVLFSAISFCLPYSDLPKLWIIGSVVTFLLPLGILVLCYCRVYLAAKEHLSRWKTRQPTLDGSTPSAEELRNTKAALTLAVITGIFAALFLPKPVVNFVRITLQRHCHRMWLNIAWFWAAALSHTSSAINPWIYAIRMANFKKALKQLLWKTPSSKSKIQPNS